MSIRNLLRKAADLVVELPDEEPSSDPLDLPQTKTVQQVVRETPGPNLDEIKVAPQPTGTVSAPGGKVEFADVYSRAGLPQATFTAEQALEVMSSLPSDLAIEVRRKAVQTTLQAMGKAMGVDTQSVVADASRKMAALAAYGDSLEHQTNQFTAAAEAKIADLDKQIADQRASIDEVKKMLADALAKCQAESHRLDDVLEFFTLDIAPSKLADKPLA